MITKLLVTAGIAVVASVGLAVPAFADPASFGDLGCTCQPPVVQGPIPHFFLPPDYLLNEGIRQGLADTEPGAIQP